MRNSLAKNTILLSIGTLLNKALQFIMIPFFSRWISVEDFGTFDLLSIYALLLVPVLTLSSADAVFRFSIDAADRDDKKRYISNGLTICTVVSLFFTVVINATGKITGWSLALPFSLFVLGEVFDAYLRGYLRGIKKLNIYSFCSALTTFFIAISVTVFVLIFEMGLYGMIYGYALGYLIGECIIILITRLWHDIDLRSVSLQGCGELIKYSYPLIPNNICWWVIGAFDRLVINYFFGAFANGIYSIAHKVPNLCSAVFGVFNVSWQQAASEITDEKSKGQYFSKVLNSLLTIIITLCIGINACSFILFDYVFDAKYAEARMYTPVLVFALVFSSVANFLGGIQISMKNTKANGISTFCGALANIVVHISLVKVIGLYAACISTFVAYVAVCAIRWNTLTPKYHFMIEKKNWCLLILYLYFAACQYMTYGVVWLHVFNLVLACTIFVLANQKLLRSYLQRVLSKIKV